MFLYAVTKIATNDEMVKQMQEQVISMQDKQINFLNDAITNAFSIASIAVAIVSLFFASVATWISSNSAKAKKTMEQAEKILGDAAEVKESLLQDKANLERYREETRQEFQELIALVNSDEIAQIKKDTKLLIEKNEIKIELDKIKGYITAGENLLQSFKQTGASMDFLEIGEFDECKRKQQYFEIYRNHPLNDVEKAERISLGCKELEERCYEVIIQMQKLWNEHYKTNLSEGSEDHKIN